MWGYGWQLRHASPVSFVRARWRFTFELFEDAEGTKLVLTHQACFYDGSGGPEMRKVGWRLLLDRLGQAMAN